MWSVLGCASSSLESHMLFFQAEYGIRDYKVTGVQTCALPISLLRPLYNNTLKFSIPPRTTANSLHHSASLACHQLWVHRPGLQIHHRRITVQRERSGALDLHVHDLAAMAFAAVEE